MNPRRVFLAILLTAAICWIPLSHSLACEECMQTDDGIHGCQAGHKVGHEYCTPHADGSGCSVSGSCGGRSAFS